MRGLIAGLLSFVVCPCATGAHAQVPSPQEVVAHAWDRAMVANDPDSIGMYIADDWTIIGSDGSVGDKNTFLELVRSGELTHNVMESHDVKVRVYGDTAVVTALGVS